VAAFLRKTVVSITVFALFTVGLMLPAHAAVTSLGATTSDSTFEIETTTSQNVTINSVTSFNDLVITGFTGNVRVVVTTTAGTVKLNTTTGLTTVTGYQSPIDTAAASIGFTATVADANIALNDLRFIADSVKRTGTIQVDVSSAGAGTIVYNSTNGHYYQYVTTPVTWEAAAAAINLNSGADFRFNGMQGYFATVTSAAENAFVTSKVGTADAWLGGSDATTEGTWKWIDLNAPESGQAFWTGGIVGTVSGYANWGTNQPDNFGSGSGEDALQIVAGGTGLWNDLPAAFNAMGYVVEYGGKSETITEASAQRIIKFRTRAAQATLSVNPVGQYLRPLTLSTTGGSGEGAVTYALSAGGTATDCSLTDGVLTATTLGTCLITATKAQDGEYLVKSSALTAVAFKTYLGDTTANSINTFYGSSITLNEGLGLTSKIEAQPFTGSVRAEIVATAGTVQVVSTAGLTTVTGYQSPVGTAAVSIAFEGTITAVNTALNTLKFNATASPGSPTVTITVSPISSGSSLAYNTANGHYYQYVTTPVTWDAAAAAITANTDGVFTFNGLTGYFATVTSAEENAFIKDKVGTAAAWLGGSDAAVEGTWKWVGGPEAGNTLTYINWNSGEPNNSGSNEDALQILSGGTGQWNDLSAASQTLGYVVEYGGVNSQVETLTAATRTVTIVVARAPQENLSITSINATFGTPFTLIPSGGTGTGVITYAVANGTATGCSLDGSGKLVSTSEGTCLVTATKPQDANYLSKSSAATTVTFWGNTIGTPSAPIATVGNGQATLTWGSIANAQSYTITANPGGLTCTTTETTCVIAGLTNGVAYTFTIVATNPLAITSTVSPASPAITPVVPSPIVFGGGITPTPTPPAPTPPTTPNNPVVPGTPNVPSTGANGQRNTPLAPSINFTPTSSRPTANNVQIIDNGVESSVSITPNIAAGAVKVASSDWDIALSVVISGVQTAPVSTSGNLVFTSGVTSTLSGNGFDPDSLINVFIRSNPIFLGKFKTNSLGEVKGKFSIPKNLAPGLHTLQLHNISGPNANKVISISIEVKKKVNYKKARFNSNAGAEEVPGVISIGSREKGITPVRVNLPSSFNGQLAILQRAKGNQGFTLLFTQVLDSEGNALFKVSSDLKSGEKLRLRVGNRTLGSTVIP
jgi:hypothetical protein